MLPRAQRRCVPTNLLRKGGEAGAGQGRIPRHWSLMQGEPLPSSAELRLSLLVSPANPQNACDYNGILCAIQGQSGGQVSGGPRFPRPRQPQPQAESKPTVRPLGGQGPQTPQPRPLLQTSGLCVIPWRVRGPQQVGKGASTRVSHLLRDGFHVTPTQGHQEHPPALSCCQGWGPPDAALGSKSVGTLLSKLQITSALWT